MATKLGRKEIPAGHSAADFTIVGRASKDQNDFGPDVGCADMACVNQFGEANNSKYYHGAVVKSTRNNVFFVYLEWGRTFNGQSWNGDFAGQDFQFVECSSEADARDFFAKQMAEKNTKRGEWKTVGTAKVWAARAGKDGYIVQKLATRQKGLPDAYKIKDNSGLATVKVEVKADAVKKAAAPAKAFHPMVVSLATALVGGTKSFTKALTAATGVTPTQEAIEEVRNILIPAAMHRISKVGSDVAKQVKDIDLRDISKMVSALVPQEIPRTGVTDEEAILNSNNILRLQQNLDAFESSLKNEDFEEEAQDNSVNPDSMLNAKLTWLDPNSEIGRWVTTTYKGMTRNRHGYGNLTVLNVFAVERPDRDIQFLKAVKDIAAKRKDLRNPVAPELQPAKRPDLGDISDYVKDANVFLGIHGTRSVNVSPIISTHFRMPKSLKGVPIAGAAFGHGVYMADDVGKSAGYVGDTSSRWSAGGGISGRGNFMFLCDVAGGKHHYPRNAWGIDDTCPEGGDSVFAHPNYCRSLANNEYVVFNPAQVRIRYLVEVKLR